MSTSALRAPAPVRPGPGGTRSSSRLWRRWIVVVTAGEAAGFLVPVLAVASGAAALPGAAGLAVLLAAGAGEGALLGAAQAAVLAREVPGFSRRDWALRTAAAAVVAWTIGAGPSTWAGGVLDWSVGAQVALAVPASAILLVSIGWAQWTVLRRHVPRAGRWILWTAAAWSAGLVAFTGVTTPLWQPGQAPWLIAVIGVLGGLVMATTMAVVTGRGAVVLLAQRAGAAAGSAMRRQQPEPWTSPGAEVTARTGVESPGGTPVPAGLAPDGRATGSPARAGRCRPR